MHARDRPSRYGHRGVFFSSCGGLSSAVPSPRLKQDGQDGQDLQDGGCSGIRSKGLEDLNVYSISRNERLRSDRTLMRRGGWGACEGQALALRLRRRADRAAVVRGPSRLYQRSDFGAVFFL